jgi:NEDD8-activating enzyme E1 regulatory subunit
VSIVIDVGNLIAAGFAANALASQPRETATHLALSALFALREDEDGTGSPPSGERLRQQIQRTVGDDVQLPEALDDAIGEL